MPRTHEPRSERGRAGRGNSGVYFRACTKLRRKRLRLTKQEACMASSRRRRRAVCVDASEGEARRAEASGGRVSPQARRSESAHACSGGALARYRCWAPSAGCEQLTADKPVPGMSAVPIPAAVVLAAIADDMSWPSGSGPAGAAGKPPASWPPSDMTSAAPAARCARPGAAPSSHGMSNPMSALHSVSCLDNLAPDDRFDLSTTSILDSLTTLDPRPRTPHTCAYTEAPWPRSRRRRSRSATGASTASSLRARGRKPA